MAVDVALWMLVGLPGCGKSTWARQFAVGDRGYGWVSTDAIRASLYGDEAIQGTWGEVWTQVQQDWRQAVWAIHQGQLQGVIYDATNVRRRYRREAIATARQLGFTTIIAYWFDVPLEVCLERNRQRSRQVPAAVIATMHHRLMGAPPVLAEGFDQIVRLTTVQERPGDR